MDPAVFLVAHRLKTKLSTSALALAAGLSALIYNHQPVIRLQSGFMEADGQLKPSLGAYHVRYKQIPL